MDPYLTHFLMLGYLFCASVAINEISVVVWIQMTCAKSSLESILISEKGKRITERIQLGDWIPGLVRNIRV